jgi:hypothetical protein
MTMFSQRHYEAIATTMQECRREFEGLQQAASVLNFVEAELAALFKSDNVKFKPERFRAACVPGANVRARG